MPQPGTIALFVESCIFLASSANLDVTSALVIDCPDCGGSDPVASYPVSIFIAYTGSLIILATTSEEDPQVVPSGCVRTPG
ncbi:Uncharacterised protein [Mycobacteroides abscessus subsp. massiliense]|nr:Uncharacterised protein [Mycobacteroides abscessus subsp. massiliense]